MLKKMLEFDPKKRASCDDIRKMMGSKEELAKHKEKIQVMDRYY